MSKQRAMPVSQSRLDGRAPIAPGTSQFLTCEAINEIEPVETTGLSKENMINPT